MGDRSNVVIEDFDGSRVYLYAHWAGEDILKSAVHGLESGRYNDSAYLARIVFEHMIRNDRGLETGFGISTVIQDNEHPIFVISNHDQFNGTRVWFENASGDAVSEQIPHTEFLDIVYLIEGWEELTEVGELYETLISNMPKK